MSALTEQALLSFLDANSISYQRVEHPPVFTCEEADRYRIDLPAVHTKNLFLRSDDHHFYIAMTACEKRLDMKSLGRAISASKLHFGSPAELMDILGLTPGSVTVLGLLNDTAHRVDLLVDADIWDADTFLCHPLVNTATLVISKAHLKKFFELTGHSIHVVGMPAQI